jgi:hypothetical protein
MRGVLAVLFNCALLVTSVAFLGRADAQTQNPPNKIQDCTDILQRLQIPTQSTNPTRIINCRDDVTWFDNVQQYDRMAVVVTIEFPSYVQYYFQGNGYGVPGWHQCLQPGSNPYVCEGNNFSIERYAINNNVSQWAAKAYSGTASSPGRFFDNFMSPPQLCTNTGTGTVINTKDGQGQPVQFSCRSNWLERSENPYGYFSDLGGPNYYPRKNYDITAQYALIFERVLTASFTANPSSISSGQSSTLIWATEGAVSVVIDNEIGAVPLDGSLNVSPSVDTLYTLTATASGGETAIRRVTVDVQDYCDPGGGGSSLLPGFGIGRAQAQAETCKPDLILVLDTARVSVTTRNGQTINATDRYEIGVGDDIVSIKVEGARVKNIGTATARGESTFSISYIPLLEFDKYPVPVPISLNLAVNALANLPTLTIPFGRGNLDPSFEIEREYTSGFLTLKIDDARNIAELNEENNESVMGKLHWAMIKVVTKHEGAVVAFETVGSQTRTSVTDKNKTTYLAPTNSLYGGPKSYTIKASVGGSVVGQVTQEVTAYQLYEKEINVQPRLTVKVAPKIEYSSEGSYSLKPKSGTVTVQSRAGQLFTDSLVNGFAVFEAADLDPTDYRIKEVKAHYQDEFSEDPLGFLFPEPSRGEVIGSYFSVPAAGHFLTQPLLLAKKCQAIHVSPLTYCIYNDADTQVLITLNQLPQAQKIANTMLGWKSFSPRPLRTIIHSPDPRRSAAGYYYSTDEIYTHAEIDDPDAQYKAVIWHEIFHLLDDYYAEERLGGDDLSQEVVYYTNALNQFNSQTGRRLWDLTLGSDHYDSGAGYTSKTVIKDGKLKVAEVLAQEHEIICQYPTRYLERMYNIRNLWQGAYGQVAPNDLEAQMEIQKKRLEGRLPGISPRVKQINTILKTWYSACTGR